MGFADSCQPARAAAGPQTWPYRYELLDGLRGLAALAVVATHLGASELGHAAVMVFFVISGYCVTAAAESCRRTFVVVVGALLAYSLAQILPWRAHLELAPRVWMDLAVASGFALVLFFGRPLSAGIARQSLWRPISALGVISYSLYLVHQFNLTLANTVASRIAPDGSGVARVAIALAVLLLIAKIFWYCCERPFLNRGLTPLSAAVTKRSHAPPMLRIL